MNKTIICVLAIGLILMSFVLLPQHHWFGQPAYFPKPVYNFSQNPLDSNKIELGRILFYDPILSKNNAVSCASCHSPYNAFAHTDHDLSHGIFDSVGNRNAPALFNLAWQSSFMWDGAINHLDVQALAPISHPKEMGSDIVEVIKKLSASADYKKLFFRAYQDSLITSSKILKSIAQFQLTLVSANSKYDKVKLGKDIFSEQEKKGYYLFQKNCANCHAEPLFSTYHFENNGLPLDTILKDFGRFVITQKPKDKRKFKVPSLRNLSYTYPYMHDGRFSTLKEVINHYASGIETSATLSPQLTKSITLTSNEKVDLIAFLLTLNDKEFVFAPKHQFKNNK
ncbi:cytochrome c peroxidase [Flexibacter flexilis DSM 6793]|uniref:Cytochrome c peroxidase n=1 Tax=Flexibacter flexilis DSM 6793 TaxID=927664 RepID=A0A1I1DPB1_9BACT|nr:cytochrome c peroxidase [Flexibacter flexilis]SFB76839.1 cytochrome c peroxidase [Flexibacter flexilis DSM 6793]